jgi:hypothetical protein
MSKHEQDEKSEKGEKELQKQEEKTEEKSVEEKWRRDPLGSAVWALILIWAGVVLLASNIGWLETLNGILAQIQFQLAESPIAIPELEFSAWSLIFLGAGVLLLAEVLIRLLIPSYRRPVLGTTILAIVFLAIGIGSWGLIWPLVLILIGIALLLGGLFGRK